LRGITIIESLLLPIIMRETSCDNNIMFTSDTVMTVNDTKPGEQNGSGMDVNEEEESRKQMMMQVM